MALPLSRRVNFVSFSPLGPGRSAPASSVSPPPAPSIDPELRVTMQRPRNRRRRKAGLFVIEQPLVRLKNPPRDGLARHGGDGIVPEILVTELSAAGFRHESTLGRFAGQLHLVIMLRP